MTEIITDQDARYAIALVKTICAEAGPGLPGTPQEHARAAILRKELVTHLGAENVAEEEFDVAPGSFLGSQHLSAVSILLAALLNLWIGRLPGIAPGLTIVAATVAALTFALIPAVLFVGQFYFGLEISDRFFKKTPSVNVVGRLRRPGTVNVKRLLILSGHHDSAWENNWIRLLGAGFYFVSTIYLIGLVVILTASIIQLTGAITGNASILRAGTLGWVLLAFPILPSIIFGLYFHRRGKKGGIVPGAVDNLSASALAVAMCRFLAQNPAYIPEDTEIRFVSFGSEEAGLRGSRRYVKRHLDELKRLDARLLNFEMIAYPEIGILTSDINGTVQNSPAMVTSIVEAARRAGVPYQVKSSGLGIATDTGPFSRAGLKATTLLPFNMAQQWAALYHQQADTPEALTVEPLLNALRLTLEWLRCGGE